MSDVCKDLHCVHGGEAYQRIGSDFSGLNATDQVIAADVLDAWYPPSPRVLQKLEEHLAWACRTSPPVRGDGLKKALAEAFAVPRDQIVLGNGTSDLIFRLLPHIFASKRPVVIPVPCYGEYAHVLEQHCQIRVDRFSCYEDDLDINVDELIKRIVKIDAGGLVLVNPCNPTGRYLKREQLIKIAESTKDRIPILIDETYFAFAPENVSMQDYHDTYPNLWFFRSLSKVYALSGLRVGYALVPNRMYPLLDSLTPPYAVSTLAQMAAIEALRDEDYIKTMIAATAMRREKFVRDLSEIRTVKVLPSVINSLLIDLDGSGISSHACVSRLAQRGIFVRDISSQGQLGISRYIRVAVLDYAANQAFVRALGEIIGAL